MTWIGLATLVVTALFAFRLARTPHDRGLWILVIGLVLFLLSKEAIIAGLRVVSDDLVTPGIGKLVQNCALTLGFYAVMCVFLLSASGTRYAVGLPGERPRIPVRAWWDGAAAATVCGALVALMAATPPEFQAQAYPADGALQRAALERPEVVAFYAVAAGYFAYAASCSAVWALQYRRESSPRVRVGLVFAAAGMVAFAFGSAGRSLYALARGLDLPVPGVVTTMPTAMITVGAAAWLTGLLVVGIAARWAAFRVWRHHRRQHHVLHVLWAPLHAAFPEDALDHTHPQQARGRRWQDRVVPGRVHRAYWRRAIECRDGLSKLSPWLRDLGYRPEAEWADQADAVHQALALRDSGHTPSSHRPMLVAAPNSPATTVEDDVGQLVALAHAMKHR